MPALSSTNAAISYNSQVSTGLLTVTVNHTGDMIETADIADQRKSYIAGQATSTASGEIFYDQGDPCMDVMESDSVNPVSRAVVITLSTGMTVTGNAFVTSFSATAGTNDVVRANFELQFTGAVTIA
jgi:hypothetical protein